MSDTATRVAALGRVVDHHAEADAVVRRVDATAKAHARAAETGRGIEAHARATGQDLVGYTVLTPGTPEHAKAERDLMRARAL